MPPPQDPGQPIRIGLISDTHGLLRPEAKAALAGSLHIVHAGDIGNPRVLEELADIAPVTAVRGNNDRGDWAESMHQSEVLQFGDCFLYVLHDLGELDLDPVGAGFKVVVTGHSHQPKVQEREDVIYINPGSAGPRRFRLPVTVAELTIEGAKVSARIIDVLQVDTA